MSISRVADTFYTYRFLRTLTKKWVDMEAYELGIIDENGKLLKKGRELKTQEEKSAYTLFHRLVFNIKRLLEKLPFGKSAIASYAAALFLLKEETGMSEEQIEEMMTLFFKEIGQSMEQPLEEEASILAPGVYRLKETCLHPTTGEEVIPKGTKVMLPVGATPVAQFFGVNLYEAHKVGSETKVYITAEGVTK